MVQRADGESPRVGVPIDVLQDVLIHQQPIMERPSDAYFVMANGIHDRVQLIESLGTASPELVDDTAYCIAFRDALLGSELFSENEAAHQAQRQSEMVEHQDERIQPHGVTMDQLQDRAKDFSVPEIYDYFLSKLESYTVFLATGKQPTNWPETTDRSLTDKPEATGGGGMGLLSMDIPSEVINLAETLYASAIQFIDELGGPIDCIEYIQRYQDWLQETCDLLLSKRCVGLAVPLMNTARRIDEQQALQDKLALALAEVREQEGEHSYRRVYGFAASQLREPLLSDFLAANQKQEAPLTFGATRKVERIGKTAILVELFEQGELVHTLLHDGEPVVLPYRDFVSRGLFNYQEPTEREMLEAQTSVKYEDLDDSAKDALEAAWRAAELERHKPLTALEIRDPAIEVCREVATDFGLHVTFHQPKQAALSGSPNLPRSQRKRIGNGNHKDWFIDYQEEEPQISDPTVVGRIAIIGPHDPANMQFGGFAYLRPGEPEPTYDHITVHTPSELDHWRPKDPSPELLARTYQGLRDCFETNYPRLFEVAPYSTT